MRTFNITGRIWGADQDDSQAVKGETLSDALFNYYDLMERRWIEENAPTTSPECVHIETGTGNHTRECVEPCYGVYVSRIEEIIPLYVDGVVSYLPATGETSMNCRNEADREGISNRLMDTPFGVELIPPLY